MSYEYIFVDIIACTSYFFLILNLFFGCEEGHGHPQPPSLPPQSGNVPAWLYGRPAGRQTELATQGSSYRLETLPRHPCDPPQVGGTTILLWLSRGHQLQGETPSGSTHPEEGESGAWVDVLPHPDLLPAHSLEGQRSPPPVGATDHQVVAAGHAVRVQGTLPPATSTAALNGQQGAWDTVQSVGERSWGVQQETGPPALPGENPEVGQAEGWPSTRGLAQAEAKGLEEGGGGPQAQPGHQAHSTSLK